MTTKLQTAARAALVMVAWCALGPTGAQAAGRRVGVVKFEGPGEAIVRARVVRALKAHRLELVAPREIQDTAERLGVNLDDGNGAFRAVAKELAISAFVTGEVGKKRVQLSVRNGSDGSVTGEASWPGRGNPRRAAAEVGKTFWRRLGSAVERGKPPSGARRPARAAPEPVAEAPEETPAAEPRRRPSAAATSDEALERAAGLGEPADPSAPPDAEPDRAPEEIDAPPPPPARPRGRAAGRPARDEAARGDGTRALPQAFDLAVGGRAFTRHLTYNQELTESPRQYRLPLGAAAGMTMAWFPVAHFSAGALAHVGLVARYEQSFALSSHLAGRGDYPTTLREYAAGVRIRIPFGAHAFWIEGDYGEHSFVLTEGTGGPREQLDLPDVVYGFARGGLGLRVALPASLSLLAGGGYRHVLSAGDIKDQYFPRATLGGIDLSLGLGFALTRLFEVRAGVDLRRYFYSMNSQATDPYRAGGAIDQYITGWMALALTI